MIGKRVEIAPHYDYWMRGARYGTVMHTMPLLSKQLGRPVVKVKLDLVARPQNIFADDCTLL